MARVAMIGGTGAVGSEVVEALDGRPGLQRVTSFGRRPVERSDGPGFRHEVLDLMDADAYWPHLTDHDVAICTLGVGQPSKMSKEDFKRIDHDLVLAFAQACAAAGVRHFQLLSSVGVSPTSSSFYLRTKGQLEDRLRGLGFDRLSLFHPSMILTPTNRYGFSQAVTLRVWPLLTPFLQLGLRRLRGVRVADLGGAIAENVFTSGEGVEVLEWDDFRALASKGSSGT